MIVMRTLKKTSSPKITNIILSEPNWKAQNWTLRNTPFVWIVEKCLCLDVLIYSIDECKKNQRVRIYILSTIHIDFNRHTGNKLQACQQCNKLFITRSKLKAHMSTHLNDGRSFECYLCPFKFDRWVGLRLHFTAKHSANRKEILVCTYCDKKFVNEKKFSLHVRVVSERI